MMLDSEEAERKMEKDATGVGKADVMNADRAEMAKQQEQMWKELQAQKIEMQEKEMRHQAHQAALTALHREKKELE